MRWPWSKRPPILLHIEFRDRHGEHVDPTIPLCGHEDYTLWPGDNFKGDVEIGIGTPHWNVDALGQVEIVYLKPGRIRVIVNHPDYLSKLAERKLEQALADAVDVATWLTGASDLTEVPAWPEMRAKLNRASAVVEDLDA